MSVLCLRMAGPLLALALFAGATMLMFWSMPDHSLSSPILAASTHSISKLTDPFTHIQRMPSPLPAIDPATSRLPPQARQTVAPTEAGAPEHAPNLRRQEGPKASHGLASRTDAVQVQDDYPNVMDVLRSLFELSTKDPDRLIQELKFGDPLNTSAGPVGFRCPQSRESLLADESAVDQQRLQRFVAGEPGTWIFYQHLRKAGGTGFCQLATDNLKKREIPPYYCMIDNRGSLATPPWNNPEYVVQQMIEHKFRITSNEWDVFYRSMLQWPGAIFATTIRDPVDRIFSQYRFEHLEHRDGSQAGSHRMSAKEFYMAQKGWTMGSNYYLKTFIGDEDKVIAKPKTGDFYWTYHKYNNKKITWEMFQSALQTIMQFHLIFVTEWLEPSSIIILNRTIHWASPPKQVLPHEVQAVRQNKASKGAESSMSAEDYKFLLSENILDLLFFRSVQRIYLERLAC